jgi:uncharacterized protein
MNGIGHIEIPTRNLDESVEFYTNAFGWECRKHSDYYAFFKTPNGMCGGFEPSSIPSADAGVLLYIETDDIFGLLTRIESYGGKTLKSKTEIGENMGFFALFLDPHGNRFGLWSKE